MKYGESTFDILYLLFAVIGGVIILKKARNRYGRLMGFASLILGCGDAFHLIPRVLNYFIDTDFNLALGIGKLITSVTMTVFYALIYYIWLEYYKKTAKKSLTATVWLLVAFRIILCAFPQNGWIENNNDLTWGIIRNVPFIILGILVCALYCKTRNESQRLKPVWVYILLSFAFYIPVTVGAWAVPLLGMLMLPKTVCYILMIVTFLFAVLKDRSKENR